MVLTSSSEGLILTFPQPAALTSSVFSLVFLLTNCPLSPTAASLDPGAVGEPEKLQEAALPALDCPTLKTLVPPLDTRPAVPLQGHVPSSFLAPLEAAARSINDPVLIFHQKQH